MFSIKQMREVNILSLSQETQASWVPNGRKIHDEEVCVSVCVFCSHWRFFMRPKP